MRVPRSAVSSAVSSVHTLLQVMTCAPRPDDRKEGHSAADRKGDRDTEASGAGEQAGGHVRVDAAANEPGDAEGQGRVDAPAVGFSLVAYSDSETEA